MAIVDGTLVSLTGPRSGVYEGAYIDLRNSRVLLIDKDGFVLSADINIIGDIISTGDVNAVNVNASAEVNATTAVNIDNGVTVRNIEPSKDKTLAPQFTVVREFQNGTGRVNDMLNAEGGTSTFTVTADAMRFRTHPGAWTVYYGDSTGVSPGDPVVWEQVLNLIMTPSGHTMTLSGGFTSNYLTLTAVSAATVPNNSIFRNNADGKIYIKNAVGTSCLINTTPAQ